MEITLQSRDGAWASFTIDANNQGDCMFTNCIVEKMLKFVSAHENEGVNSIEKDDEPFRLVKIWSDEHGGFYSMPIEQWASMRTQCEAVRRQIAKELVNDSENGDETGPGAS